MFVVSFPTRNLIMYDWSGCKTWMWSVRIHARNKGTIFKAWCAAIWSGALLFESVRTLSMPDYQYRLLREVKTANWYVLFCSATPFAELCEGPFTKKIFIITKIFQVVKVQSRTIIIDSLSWVRGISHQIHKKNSSLSPKQLIVLQPPLKLPCFCLPVRPETEDWEHCQKD